MANTKSINKSIQDAIDTTLKIIEENHQKFFFINESLIGSLLYQNLCKELRNGPDKSIIYRICKEFPLYYFDKDKKSAKKFIYDEQHRLYINSDLRKIEGRKLSLFEEKDKGNTGKAGLYDFVILNIGKNQIAYAIEIKLIKPDNEIHHGYEDLFLLGPILTQKEYYPQAKGYMCMIAQYDQNIKNPNKRSSKEWKEEYLGRVEKAYKEIRPKIYFNHILITKISL